MSTIDILTAIKARRSIHQFKSKNIPENILTEIFSYASWAPTHYMKEPWNIKLYQDEGKLTLIEAIITSYQRLGMIKNETDPKTLQMITSMRNFLFNIPHHAIIYFPKVEDLVQFEEDYASVCAFIQNAQLAAWQYGVGMLWTITPYMHDPSFLEAIHLNSSKIKIAACLQIGYPSKITKTKPRTPITEKMEIVCK